MTLSVLAEFSQIVASLGVIVSLAFVALELRKNMAQSRLANYSDLVNRYIAVYAVTYIKAIHAALDGDRAP